MAATICANPLNTSPTKQQFSFRRAERFKVPTAELKPLPSFESLYTPRKPDGIYKPPNQYLTAFAQKSASVKPFGSQGPRFSVP